MCAAPSDEPEISIRQAQLFRRRFPDWGRFGLSGFYARSNDEVLDLGEDRLERFTTLFVYSIGDVLDADFEVIATYRTPHVTIAFYDDPEQAVRRLLNVEHRTTMNSAHTKWGIMKIDLFVDLNTEDDTGLPWTYADQAADPSLIVVGRRVVVGAGDSIAIADIVSVEDDGLVRVRPLPGPVTAERLEREVTAS